MYKFVWKGNKFTQGSGFSNVLVYYDWDTDSTVISDKANLVDLMSHGLPADITLDTDNELALDIKSDLDTFAAKLSLAGSSVLNVESVNNIVAAEVYKAGAVTTYIGLVDYENPVVILETHIKAIGSLVGTVVNCYFYESAKWGSGYKLHIMVRVNMTVLYLIMKSMRFREIFLGDFRYTVKTDFGGVSKFYIISSLTGLEVKLNV